MQAMVNASLPRYLFLKVGKKNLHLPNDTLSKDRTQFSLVHFQELHIFIKNSFQYLKKFFMRKSTPRPHINYKKIISLTNYNNEFLAEWLSCPFRATSH